MTRCHHKHETTQGEKHYPEAENRVKYGICRLLYMYCQACFHVLFLSVCSITVSFEPFPQPLIKESNDDLRKAHCATSYYCDIQSNDADI